VAPFKQEVELLKEKIQALEAKIPLPAQPPKPATPQPIPQEIEIKALKEKLAQKEQELINMKDKFDKQNTNISILENNYQKALNTKNHLSYKLGQALIKANKNWYKGGYVKFIFEVIRIKKGHKNRG
jgi:chromosome segregation ATPase